MVIDSSQQGRGLGRSSTVHVLQKMAQNQNCKQLIVACHPENKAATKLYKSLGFTEFDKNYDDDPLYSLSCDDALKLPITNQGQGNFGSRDGAMKWQLDSIQSEKEFDWTSWENGLET